MPPDLAFSGASHIAATLLQAVPAILLSEGFHANPAKTRAQPAHASQIVTGIQVNRHLNLPRADYDHLKAMLHRLSLQPGAHDPAVLAHLDGRIQWAEQLNPARAARLRAAFDTL